LSIGTAAARLHRRAPLFRSDDGIESNKRSVLAIRIGILRKFFNRKEAPR